MKNIQWEQEDGTLYLRHPGPFAWIELLGEPGGGALVLQQGSEATRFDTLDEAKAFVLQLLNIVEVPENQPEDLQAKVDELETKLDNLRKAYENMVAEAT